MKGSTQSTDLSEIVRVTEGTLYGQADLPVIDVTHDSRKAKVGSLFAAVHGELFDAHKFIAQVMQQGVVGVISELERPNDFTGAWIQGCARR